MRAPRILLATALCAGAVVSTSTPSGADAATGINDDGISIVDEVTSPFPSVITLPAAEVGGTVTSATVTITDYSHTFPGDMVFIVEAPSGETVLLSAHCGGSESAVDVDLTFSELGVPLTDGVPTTGTFVPTSCETGLIGGSFDNGPAPAPAEPYGTTMADLAGATAAGDWKFYAYDRFDFSDGSIGGWALQVQTTNSDPVASDAAFETPEDTPLVVTADAGLGASTTDIDEDELEFAVETGPTNGSVIVDEETGAFTYTPDPDFAGTDSFTYTADDLHRTIRPPSVELQSSGHVRAVAGPSESTDAEPTEKSADGPARQAFVPAPAPERSSAVVAAAMSAPATVEITVQPVNDPPVAVDDAASTTAGDAVTIDAAANDTDVDGDDLTVTAVGDVTNGDVEIVDGAVAYTPDATYSGEESFTYTVSDGNGGQDEGTIVVAVAAAAVDDSATTTATSAPAAVAGDGNGRLPVTGGESGLLGRFGLLLVAFGAVAVAMGAVRARMIYVPKHLRP